VNAQTDNNFQAQISGVIPSPTPETPKPSPTQTVDPTKPREVVLVGDRSDFSWKDVASGVNSGAWAVILVFAVIFFFFRKPLNTFVSSAIEVLQLLKTTQNAIKEAIRRNTETLAAMELNDRRVAETMQRQEILQNKIVESLDSQDKIHDAIVESIKNQGEILLEVSKNVQPPIYQDKRSAEVMRQLVERLKQAEGEDDDAIVDSNVGGD
jgi:hypothetical protein